MAEKFNENENIQILGALASRYSKDLISPQDFDHLTKRVGESHELGGKFNEAEYMQIVDAVSAYYGQIAISQLEYHHLLKRIGEFRALPMKPEVKICNVQFSKLGESEVAHGYALNHPRLGRTQVRTSLVVAKAEDGSFFETLNTRYVVVPDEGHTDGEGVGLSTYPV